MKQLVRDSLSNLPTFLWYQRFSSTWVTLFAFGTFWGVYLGSITVTHIFSMSPCPLFVPSSALASSVILLAFLIISPLFLVIVLLFDFWNSRCLLCKCELRKYFIEDDPFYFRLEILFYTATVLWEIFGNYALRLSIGTQQDKYPVIWIIQWVIGQSVGIFYVCGISLIVSIYRDIRKRKNDSNVEQNEIAKILTNKDTRDLFKIFCQREWSVENLMIWVRKI